MHLAEKKDITLKEISKFHELKKEEILKLENFVDLILEKNENFNFIGRSTAEDIWNRHILDSAQLLQYIDNKNIKFADFGTGAGFPGMVLSILGLKDIALVEKSFRKSEFLHQAKEISDNKIFIYQSKLEEMPPVKFNCIISRALAPLNKLLTHSQKFLAKRWILFIFKGKKFN